MPQQLCPRLLNVDTVARLLSTTPDVIYSQPWRQRVGLPAVRIGRALRFREDDVARLIERGLEAHPREDPELGESA